MPVRSTIKATVNYKYVGGTMNNGTGAFSGTEWQWRLSGGRPHRKDVHEWLTWDDLTHT